MADDTKTATQRHEGDLVNGVPTRYGLNVAEATVEVAAAASAGSVYTMLRIPTAARISDLSRLRIDDLASTGAPLLDVGFAAVAGNITTDTTDLSASAITAATAGDYAIIQDTANAGKYAWEYTSATTDPGGFLDLIITITDAATNTGGTMTLSLVYTFDGS